MTENLLRKYFMLLKCSLIVTFVVGLSHTFGDEIAVVLAGKSTKVPIVSRGTNVTGIWIDVEYPAGTAQQRLSPGDWYADINGNVTSFRSTGLQMIISQGLSDPKGLAKWSSENNYFVRWRNLLGFSSVDGDFQASVAPLYPQITTVKSNGKECQLTVMLASGTPVYISFGPELQISELWLGNQQVPIFVHPAQLLTPAETFCTPPKKVEVESTEGKLLVWQSSFVDPSSGLEMSIARAFQSKEELLWIGPHEPVWCYDGNRLVGITSVGPNLVIRPALLKSLLTKSETATKVTRTFLSGLEHRFGGAFVSIEDASLVNPDEKKGRINVHHVSMENSTLRLKVEFTGWLLPSVQDLEYDLKEGTATIRKGLESRVLKVSSDLPVAP